MKKKKVALDVFKEAVLPMLRQKHIAEPELIQKSIDDDYEIVREVDGKEVPVSFSVSVTKTAPVKTESEIGAEIEKKVAEKVAEIAKKNNPNKPVKRVGAIEGKGVAADDDGETQKITVPAQVKRQGSINNFAAVKRFDLDQEERCYTFGMWSMACIGNPKAIQWCADHGIELKVHAEGSNTAGGYTVPEVLSTDFIDLKERYGVARRLFDRYPMTSDTLKINRRVSGLTASFTGENQAMTESTMSLDQVQLVVKDLTAITRLSGQLNMDSVLNWSDRLAYEIGYAFANKEDLCGFNGDGTSQYGGITGVRQALLNKWTAGVPGTGIGLIKQGTSNTWGAIVMGDFDAVVGSIPQYADTERCVWVMHRTFYYTVVEKLIQAAGGVPAYEVRQGQRAPRPLFKGYPVEFSQVYPSTSTSGQVVATLGDHTLAAAFGDRMSDSISFSDQAVIGGQSMWERNQMGVRGIERFDIIVHDVGTNTSATPADAVTAAGPIVGFAVG